MAENDDIWRAKDFEIVWRHFDGESVIYSTGSGDTLLVNSFGEKVLRELAKGPLDVDSLVELLAEYTGLENDMELRFAVKNSLSNFLNHGLIIRHQ